MEKIRASKKMNGEEIVEVISSIKGKYQPKIEELKTRPDSIKLPGTEEEFSMEEFLASFKQAVQADIEKHFELVQTADLA